MDAYVIRFKGGNMIKLINGECLEEMDRLIDEGIKVDVIIADILFYSNCYLTTASKWCIL